MKKIFTILGLIGLMGFNTIQLYAVSPQPPTITSITPSAGPTSGGTSVTIVGTHLDHTTVTIGGNPATNVVIASNNQSLTATTPAGTAGAKDVVVAKEGAGSATLTGGFTYTGNLTITASSGPHGSITPSGGVSVSYGSDQSFTITPDANYHVLDVLVDQVSVGATSSYLFSNVTTTHTIDATFAIDTYTLSYLADSHGAITGSSTQVVGYGGSGTSVQAVAHTGFAFTDWSDTATSNPRTDTNVTSDLTVTAHFHDSQAPVITLLGSPTVNLVVGDPAYVDAGATALDNLDGDITQSIMTTTTPSPVSTAATGTYTIHYNVSDAAGNTATEVTRTVNVTETPIVSHTITVGATTNGSISPAGPAVIVNDGTDQSFSISAVSGYHILDVVIDQVSVGATSTYLFSNVTAGHTIDATFAVNSTTNPPVITLLGDAVLTLTQDYVFVDPMASAMDAEDGDLTAFVIADRTLDTTTVQSYTITYSVTDSDQNTATTSREVVIIPRSGGAGGTSGVPVCKDPLATNYDPSGVYSGGPCYYPSAPEVLGAATTTVPETQGQVLGVSTSSEALTCTEYLALNAGLSRKALRQGANNDSYLVTLLQRFLNEKGGANIPVTGYFGPLTTNAVKAFQLFHKEDVLAPWGLTKPTGIVYVTTIAHINNIQCPTLNQTIRPQDLVPARK